MAHNTRINLFDSFYVNGQPLPASFYQNLDTARLKAINADDGGTWAPSSPIFIGGAGIALAGPSTIGNGATIRNQSGGGKRLVHAANDTPVVDPAGSSVLTFNKMVTPILGSARNIGPTRGFGGNGQTNLSNHTGKRMVCPLRVHQASTLAFIELTLSVATHTSFLTPASLGQWRVYATDAFGNIFPLNTDPTKVSPGGWLSFPFTMHATTGLHTLIYFTTVPAPVDAAGFGYMIDIIDESGPGSAPGNTFLYAATACGAITNVGVQ